MTDPSFERNNIRPAFLACIGNRYMVWAEHRSRVGCSFCIVLQRNL
jgi:hypothetical protein